MQKIYLVRHGQDEDNRDRILNGHRNSPLTDLGRKQAHDVGKQLTGKSICVIYSSPLQRAFETAQIIANELDLPTPTTEELLIERDCGVLTGKPIEDIPKLATKMISVGPREYFFDAEGAESFPVMYERAKHLLAKLKELEPDRNILLVSHGAFGKIIRSAFYNWTWQEGLDKPYLGNAGIIVLSESGKWS